MATFESADEFYGVFGAFLTDLMSDAEIGPKFAEVGKALLMRFSNPDATILLDCTATGGQASLSPRIENYLGFPSGISGSELAERAVIQAKKFGAHITVPAEARGLGTRDGYQVVHLDDGTTIMSRAVLISTGARPRGTFHRNDRNAAARRP